MTRRTIRENEDVDYWHHEQETIAREILEEYQVGALRDAVKKICEHVPFYSQLVDQAGPLPEDITSLDDITHFPFITKNHLRYHYPLDFLAVPGNEVALVQATSGTSGKPVVVPYTQKTWNDGPRVSQGDYGQGGCDRVTCVSMHIATASSRGVWASTSAHRQSVVPSFPPPQV